MSFGGGETSPSYSTDDPASPYFGASANYGSTPLPQGILDYGSQNAPSPQYQGLFGNQPGLFGMSPQWRDFLYLTASALRDRGNYGRTDSFGNAMGRLQDLNQPRARSDSPDAIPVAPYPDPRQQQADDEMASANYGSSLATVTQPIRINSADEYQRLPSGMTYIAPDGRLRRKP